MRSASARAAASIRTSVPPSSGAQSIRPSSPSAAAGWVQTSPRASPGTIVFVFSSSSPRSRSQTAQKVCPTAPTWTRAAQSSSSSLNAPR